MEAKNVKGCIDRCGSEAYRISIREEISGVIQTRSIYDEEDDREFTFLTNAKHLSALDVANFYKKNGWLNSSLNGSSSILRLRN
jgi:hypothetical protein